MKLYDTVIVGGGPVGIGLAIDLGQRGHSVCVIERYARPQPIPKGQNLTQRTAEHFHAWGCEAELRAARTVPKDAGIGGVTCYGQLMTDHAYDWLNRALVRDYYFRPNERLPQYATEAVLRARVAELPNVEVRYGWSFEALEQDAEGVTLQIREHRGEVTDSVRGRYAVGCDGSHSKVRQAAGITQTLSDHDRLMALVVFTSPELNRMLDRFPGKAFYCVLHPELEGYWLFFGRVDQEGQFFFHAPVPAGTTAENFDFAAYLHRAVGQAFDLTLDHIGLWDLRFAIADSYRAGRVLVAGDAAHSHPPYGGYGINTGFEDARNLGWKLSARLSGWGSEVLLDSYDAERRPVFASTARDFIERFIHEDRAFLDTYSPEKDVAEFEEKWSRRNEGATEVAAFAPNYAGSPIIGGEGAPSARGDHQFRARAGHHLAPLALPGGGDVYDRLGDDFALLAFGPGAGEVEAFAVAAAGQGVPLRVIEGPAGSRYGARLVLVRPDHYVAWAGDRTGGDADSAAAILARATGGKEHHGTS